MRYLVLAPAFSLLAFVASDGRGDENPFNAVYRSLDKWGRSVKQELEEEATPTPAKKAASSFLYLHAASSSFPVSVAKVRGGRRRTRPQLFRRGG